ncbi:MAG: hypothetical protein H7Y03_02610 [Chitinophagaceae bacterium]|nr:hypothetical protein [Chitinophagaceae bacterium]
MELHLQRTYFSRGTNGILKLEDSILCFTIELPWRDNGRGLSCIPEGKYSLEKRYSPRLKDHLQVEHVPGRTLILIHPANNALTELKGCIAPVSNLTGEGTGDGSKAAFGLVRRLVYKTIQAGERVWLVID